MNSQEYDQSGRLSKEDELMMIKPANNMSCDKAAPEPETSIPGHLSSTPTKHDFMHQENMKRIEMPKAFQL
eukprot:CAMPEP_0176193220 /NCGR_PEP_ID=MMETSP0121_2-20121125/5372_1 /TAXON_ID=160619 /ORGANISM="Kryptoperidinium foliaceum, Strain CCMP 1326" /LENGTH=70 /DNA_ID=CAMNT_0017531927 /DNA_START=26 /DNA_END=238 /DNA_ORIENTATION=+